MANLNVYTTLSSWAVAVSWTLKAEGMDAETIFQQAGLQLSDLEKHPTGRTPIENMTRLWEISARASTNPAFGLKVSEHVHAMHFKALGMLTVTSESIAHAFEKIVAYHALISDSVIISLRHQPDLIGFSINENEGADISHCAIDAFFAVILKFCQNMLGNVTVVRAVELKRPAPENDQPWQRFYAFPVLFSQTDNILWLDRKLLEQTSIHHDQQMLQVNEDAVQDYLQAMNANNWTHRCKQNIRFSVNNLPATLASLAEKFNLSERTLARKLKEENTTFRELFQQKREEVACYYLTKTDESIVSIALQLGFQDTSNFNRAFQRWKNMPPSEYRLRYRLKK